MEFSNTDAENFDDAFIDSNEAQSEANHLTNIGMPLDMKILSHLRQE